MLIFNQGTRKFDSKNLAVFDENNSSYYLKKADKDIIFRVRCDPGSEFTYSLVDNEDSSLNNKVKRASKGCYDILPPPNGYEAGEKYTLSLPNGVSFVSDDLKNARSLVFSIEKEAVESYEFTDAVVKVDTVVGDVIDDTLDISDLSVNVGDIVFGQDRNDEYVVYKITGINEDGTAAVTTPAVDEIYSDLEVYGEYTWDINNIVFNPDIEVEIIDNVKQSSFYKSLILTAYAADAPQDGKINVKITPYKDLSIKIEIMISLEPGENGLFGNEKLKNQKVSLTLITKTKLSFNSNISLKHLFSWDLSATNTTDYSWKIDISYFSRDLEKDDDLKSLFFGKNKLANLIDYQKNVRKITEKLNNLKTDKTAGEIKLFDWKLPVPSVPGLYFSSEIKLFVKLDFAANITVGHSGETVYEIGVCFHKKQFKPYSNTYVLPCTPTSRAVFQIFSELLGVFAFDIHDKPDYACGGDTYHVPFLSL